MTRYGSRYFVIILTMPVFVATCVLAIGCGGDSVSSATVASMPITKVQAIAYADAVNVRAGDLPGLGVGVPPAKREITRGPFAPAMEKCDPTVVHAGKVVGIISRHFVRATAHKPDSSRSLNFTATEGVQSIVYVMESAGLASKELATIDGARGRICAKRFLENETITAVQKHANSEKPLYSQVSASTLTSSPLRGVSTFGLRMTAPVAVPGTVHVRYYEDFLGFVVGRALVILSDDGYRPRAFPSGVERYLLTVLYRRAHTRKL
jgi:hypothetical protein